jgi:NADH dehydrogenase FAD-containing subunit
MPMPHYNPQAPSYLIPVGEKWAVGDVNGKITIGFAGWLMRKWFDLRFFMSILPLQKALLAFRSDSVLWETCPICAKVST